MKCPVCAWEHPSMLCPRCGFDSSRDCEKYPTFGSVEKVQAVSALREQWEASQKMCADISNHGMNETEIVPNEDSQFGKFFPSILCAVTLIEGFSISVLNPFPFFLWIVVAVELIVIIAIFIKRNTVNDDLTTSLMFSWGLSGCLLIPHLVSADWVFVPLKIAVVCFFLTRPVLTLIASSTDNTGDWRKSLFSAACFTLVYGILVLIVFLLSFG